MDSLTPTRVIIVGAAYESLLIVQPCIIYYGMSSILIAARCFRVRGRVINQPIWVWLKIKQERVHVGPCLDLPGFHFGTGWLSHGDIIMPSNAECSRSSGEKPAVAYLDKLQKRKRYSECIRRSARMLPPFKSMNSCVDSG